MSSIYADVCIVGGGTAGLACAIELAKKSFNVILCDKRTFPIDKACGEGIMPFGVMHLKRLGVLNKIHPQHTSQINGICFINRKGSRATGKFDSSFGLGIRRTALSQALMSRVNEFDNIKLLSSCKVSSITNQHEYMVVKTPSIAIRSRLIIGADGLNSFIRKLFGLLKTSKKPFRYGLRQHIDLPSDNNFVEVYFQKGIEAYVTPCGQQTNVAFLWDKERFKPKTNLSFSTMLRYFPQLEKRFEGKKNVSTQRTSGPFARNCSSIIADGVALIGDASGYLDAITGEGNSIAMMQAHALAKVIKKQFNEKKKGVINKQQLVAYQHEHKKIMAPYYQSTNAMLFFAKHIWMMDAFIDLAKHRSFMLSFFLSRAHGYYNRCALSA